MQLKHGLHLALLFVCMWSGDADVHHSWRGTALRVSDAAKLSYGQWNVDDLRNPSAVAYFDRVTSALAPVRIALATAYECDATIDLRSRVSSWTCLAAVSYFGTGQVRACISTFDIAN